jgi:hypothetical protein
MVTLVNIAITVPRRNQTAVFQFISDHFSNRRYGIKFTNSGHKSRFLGLTVYDVTRVNSREHPLALFSDSSYFCLSFVFILLFTPVFFAKKAQRIIVLSLSLSASWLEVVLFMCSFIA